MGGGAWPFLVGGAICLVNSDNERDSVLLTRRVFRRPRVCVRRFCRCACRGPRRNGIPERGWPSSAASALSSFARRGRVFRGAFEAGGAAVAGVARRFFAANRATAG